MTKKKCFKCQCELPLEAFYKHPQMADGHLGKCKDCTCRDVQENRLARLEQYRAFDKSRLTKPDRVAARKAYQASEHGKAVIAAYLPVYEATEHARVKAQVRRNRYLAERFAKLPPEAELRRKA